MTGATKTTMASGGIGQSLSRPPHSPTPTSTTSQLASTSTAGSFKPDQDVAMADVDRIASSVQSDSVDGARPDGRMPTRLAVRNAIVLLERFDTVPSILHHPIAIANPSEPDHFSGDENGDNDAVSLKRLQSQAKASVAQQAIAGRFGSAAEFRAAIDAAAAEVEGAVSHDEDARADWQARRRVLRREVDRSVDRVSGRVLAAGKSSGRDGNDDQDVLVTADQSNPTGTVLTVMAAGPNGGPSRPLFSSIQTGRRVTTEVAPGFKSEAKVAMQVSDDDLPAAVSVTRLVPVWPCRSESGPTPSRTFGDVFRSRGRSDVPPPEPRRTMTSRAATVGFVIPGTSRPDRDGPYNWTRERQPTGAWLGYTGIAVPSGPESADARRRQRDRALSTAGLEPDAEPARWETKAREEALYRAAFSSFAPDRDNLDAIVPAETKADVWWYRHGKAIFEDPAVRGEERTVAVDPLLDPGLLDGMLADFDPDEARQHLESVERREAARLEARKAGLEGRMSEITDMLQTLHSFQRLRHSALSDAAAEITGTPARPSVSETALYGAIRQQMAGLAAELPPYALARVGADPDGDLAVRTVIPIQTDNRPGLLEEDQVGRMIRAASAAAAAATAVPVPVGSSSGGPMSAGRHGPTQAAAPPAGYAASPGYRSRTPAGYGPGPGRGPVPFAPGRPVAASPMPTPRPGYGPTPQHRPFPGPAGPPGGKPVMANGHGFAAGPAGYFPNQQPASPAGQFQAGFNGRAASPLKPVAGPGSTSGSSGHMIAHPIANGHGYAPITPGSSRPMSFIQPRPRSESGSGAGSALGSATASGPTSGSVLSSMTNSGQSGPMHLQHPAVGVHGEMMGVGPHVQHQAVHQAVQHQHVMHPRHPQQHPQLTMHPQQVMHQQQAVHQQQPFQQQAYQQQHPHHPQQQLMHPGQFSHGQMGHPMVHSTSHLSAASSGVMPVSPMQSQSHPHTHVQPNHPHLIQQHQQQMQQHQMQQIQMQQHHQLLQHQHQLGHPLQLPSQLQLVGPQPGSGPPSQPGSAGTVPPGSAGTQAGLMPRSVGVDVNVGMGVNGASVPG